ncbi:tryptophan-rich sensory protein, partial [Candidatus Woesebacteria bacterium]|nr:tryptophan-rich sensory protein [Candidatus Woesebacteria bacterium]
VILIIGILICLIRIADILKAQKFTQLESLAIRLPFSVYFGWITVAVIANITAFLVSIRWNGWGIGDTVWMIVIVLVGATIGTIRMLYDRSIPYGLVFIWAYTGIIIKHVSQTGFGGAYPEIIITIVFCIIVFGAAIFKLFHSKR